MSSPAWATVWCELLRFLRSMNTAPDACTDVSCCRKQ
jgi:hypothetical protein